MLVRYCTTVALKRHERVNAFNLVFFTIFDTSILSEGIRVQRRKLSEIAPNCRCVVPSQILRSRPSKSCTYFITPASWHVDWKGVVRIFRLAPEVIGDHTLNFRPNYKFSRWKIFRGIPVPVAMCASKDCSIGIVCKNERVATPKGPKDIVSRKMSIWMGEYARQYV